MWTSLLLEVFVVLWPEGNCQPGCLRRIRGPSGGVWRECVEGSGGERREGGG